MRVRDRIRKRSKEGGGSVFAMRKRAKERRGGWGEQASFARAIADLTGGIMQPNDGSAERAGNDADTYIKHFTERMVSIRKKEKKTPERDAWLAAELLRPFQCRYGTTSHLPNAAVQSPSRPRPVPLECALRPVGSGVPPALHAVLAENAELRTGESTGAREKRSAEDRKVEAALARSEAAVAQRVASAEHERAERVAADQARAAAEQGRAAAESSSSRAADASKEAAQACGAACGADGNDAPVRTRVHDGVSLRLGAARPANAHERSRRRRWRADRAAAVAREKAPCNRCGR